ncbi:MAG: DNA methyltransferase [Terriglobales bacterium]
MAKDPAILAHQEWLGYVQPTGLVVSIPALVDASAFLNRNYGPDHQRFLAALPRDADHEVVPEIPDFVQFAKEVLNWDASLLNGSTDADPIPAELEVNLESYNETLRPKYALKNLEGERKWLLLVDVFPTGTDLDQPFAPHDRAWQASPQARFEKLLRQTGVGIGLLVNGREIRLVYAPEKELSGYITFKLAEMIRVAGRPIFAALLMLVNSERLYSVAEKERLPAILANSRKYQNVVSTQLAEQVLEALYEMLRGFQAANDQTKGELLRGVLARDPDHVYHGLLTTLLRLVFVLYAEDRALLSTDQVYSNYYSVRGLYERLRADAGRYNDTMDQRYGAWAQLLALFRLVYSGGSHGGMKIPAREGYLFDPDRYLFLEGRHDNKDKPVIPRVSDGVLYRVLSNLVLLDGERLSYRWLAVEQIGSVYQAIMGFSLQVATGRSIAIRPTKRHGAPATINLESLLSTAPDKRLKRFTDETDQKLTGPSAEALRSAATIEDLLAALERKIAKTVTPVPVPKDAMVFQPSDERRKSGSHYTPSSLTGPIVEAALEPVLEQLGPNPSPAQILNLKVCDLAMGSAAFLVEACRQLGDALTRAWQSHKEVLTIPADEDEALYAQRLIAQRCLYGLDKNQMAADLAKLSLWLATLAKDHPFTFLDHSLRHGDALVGLTRKQIASFNWEPSTQKSFLEEKIRTLVEFVTRQREEILNARENTPYGQLEQELAVADDRLSLFRMIGEALIAAFFSADKPKKREEERQRLLALVEADLKKQGFLSVDGEVDKAIYALRKGAKGVAPFHWELEFPEVFTTDKDGNVTGGFHVIVGNPPFAGKNTLIGAHAEEYLPWLQLIHPESHGNSDLVAHFFRRAFTLLRLDGCFGLIATNTIGQGDTRSTGLRWLCTHGGTVYRARKRLKWPGEAAVIVSVVHVIRGRIDGPYLLDGRPVPIITAYLFHAGGHEDPAQLQANQGKSFIGSYILGMGFTFDDTDKKGVATSLAEMQRLISKDPRNHDRIFPYLGGEEINDGPDQAPHRFVIDFEDWPLRRAEVGGTWAHADEDQRKAWLRSFIVPMDYPEPVAEDYPDLLAIVETKVKPARQSQGSIVNPNRWWMFARPATDLKQSLRKAKRAIALSRVGNAFAFAFVPTGIVYAESVVIIASEYSATFTLVQSRIHEVWTRLLTSSMKDDIRYSPTDCFVTFPFPRGHESNSILEQVGSEYYALRNGLMKQHHEGLTTIYNWFHDPESEVEGILELRALHDKLDRAVLDCYGWPDVRPKCAFFPEFADQGEIDEDDRVRKRRYRYRWPDETRDQVLALLLEENRLRAREEEQALQTQPAAMRAMKDRKTSKRSKKSGQDSTGQLTIELGEA